MMVGADSIRSLIVDRIINRVSQSIMIQLPGVETAAKMRTPVIGSCAKSQIRNVNALVQLCTE